LVATLLGISAVPNDFPNYLGMLGMHGSPEANFAVAHADLIISIGSRFDDRITGKVEEFSSRAKIIHCDIDPAEIGKIIKTDVPLVADAKDALQKLNQTLQQQKRPDWHAWIVAYRAKVNKQLAAIEKRRKKTQRLKAYEVIHAVNKVSPDAFLVSDVGQNQMWSALHFRFQKPGRFLSSGGLGSMGYGLPAGLGAAVAVQRSEVRGQRSKLRTKNSQLRTPVWCITGTEGCRWILQELVTLAQEKIPLKIAVLNNGYLGMVRQWQDLFYKKKLFRNPLFNPDFVKLAEACGVKAYRVTKPSEALAITKKAEQEKGPTLVEYLVEQEENVFPMVPPGEALKNTRIR